MNSNKDLGKENKRDSRWTPGGVQVILGSIMGAVIPSPRSHEDMVRNGRASLTPVGPIETPFGTFGYVYTYKAGCMPAGELNKGVKALHIDVSDGTIHLSYMIGKEGADYKVLVMQHRGEGEHTVHRTIARGIFDESDIPTTVEIGDRVSSESDSFIGFQAAVSEKLGVDVALLQTQMIAGFTDTAAGRGL